MQPTQIKGYIFSEILGSGSFSTVYKATKRENPKQLYAVKVFKANLEQNDEKNIQNQVGLLQRIQHPNIIRCEESFKDKGKWYVVLEYCGKGDLESYRLKQGRLPEMYGKSFIWKILEALICVHENKIVHRDLKLANILINDKFDIKLADFGFSKDYEANMLTSYCGTPLTMAPEIIDRKKYDEKCDTWSLGVISYLLLTGEYPFGPSKVYGGGIQGLKNCIFRNKGIPKFEEKFNISDEAKDFIKRCLTIDPRKRSSMIDLKAHEWFTHGIKSSLRVDFLKNSFSDSSEIIEKTNHAINGSVQNHALKLITKSQLTKRSTDRMLKLMQKYFPEDRIRQLLYLMVLVHKNQKLLENTVELRIDSLHFSLKGSEINSLCENVRFFNEFIQEEVQRIKQNLQYDKKELQNCQRKLLRMTVDFGLETLDSTTSPEEPLHLVRALVNVLMGEIKSSSIKIVFAVSEEISTQNQFKAYLEKLNREEVLNLINSFEEVNENGIVENDLSSEWLIEEDFNESKSAENDNYSQFVGLILKSSLNSQEFGQSESDSIHKSI